MTAQTPSTKAGDPEMERLRRELRATFSRYPTGVTVLAARAEGQDLSLVASTFTVGVSLDPPLVMAAVDGASRTWPELRRAGRIGASLLHEEQAAVVQELSAPDRSQRWASTAPQVCGQGALVVPGALVHMETSIHAVHPAGDHEIVVLRIHEHVADQDRRPLVYYRSGLHMLGGHI